MWRHGSENTWTRLYPNDIIGIVVKDSTLGEFGYEFFLEDDVQTFHEGEITNVDEEFVQMLVDRLYYFTRDGDGFNRTLSSLALVQKNNVIDITDRLGK